MSLKKQNKDGIKLTPSYILMLHLGIILITVGIYFFKAPNGFATGGVSGLAILLAKAL